MSLYSACLASRSKILMSLNENNLCLQDIEESLSHGYPQVRIKLNFGVI